ncbi:hypothetical protein QM042_02350 [Escherichia coli]
MEAINTSFDAPIGQSGNSWVSESLPFVISASAVKAEHRTGGAVDAQALAVV